ncbi:TetR/AcrR family transcriptional regulator [Williamsia soli]|uniref:TetR/AcrR family transcriptional regulator n=1 Tax=Williamsia soli TaxID=364929 RepID=UPI001A9E5A1E|nr:TetR/AcrR family transcriptional regulator [Williamsia soli]
MSAQVPDATVRTTSGAATRARILTAASELFYAHGIRATSADRIIAAAGITKVTFYRHFRTKSDLVVAYLEQQAAGERGWMEGVRLPNQPVESLRALAVDIGAASCSPGFRGCAFINAAAEFLDASDPVREAVAVHRQWTLNYFADIAAEAGVPEPDSVAKQLMLLRDGAMVNGYLGQAASVAGTLGTAFTSIIATAQDRSQPS